MRHQPPGAPENTKLTNAGQPEGSAEPAMVGRLARL